MGKNNVVDMTIRANMELDNISSEVAQVQKVLSKMKIGPELKRSFDQMFEGVTKEIEKVEKSLSNGFKTKGDVTGFEKSSSNLLNSLNKIETKLFKLYNLSDKDLLKLDPTLDKDIKEIEKKFANMSEDFPDNIKKGLKDVGKHVNELVKDTQKKAGKEILDKVSKKDYAAALKQAEQKLRQQQLAYDNNIYARDPKGATSVQIEAYKQIVAALREAVAYQDQFNNKAELLETEKAKRFEQTFDNITSALEKAQGAIKNVSGSFGKVSSGIQETNIAAINFNNEMESIKGKIQYFFSLANSVAVVRKILRDTIQTTKELDAAMTQTAVVTDFSVADMWKDLPRYTKEAKELGVTIKGVYETMTLYYQQGLKTQEVFEVGSETLKMAKIAGLEYAEATDYMTAALRGFNMEVNEINAQKVNDVYSELAAITAADTQEIATAMTKTASIASSANMEFETTAAFLSQIVETTRESAETAGTAMKTVIARFTELKKDPAEIGEVDGEIVDANKIETALRTINVALRDTNGQFRDLDDVFLDISSKWGDLDTNTQRYIATMAAGSRQQSRFIAMMSDYDRTMELVNAAQDSEGASQKQFDKTLESLASKLDQLKTAWQQFTMGFADDTLIKGAIDTLTFLINTLNKLTEGLPGVTKSLGNFLILGTGFKVGGKLTRAITASFGADLLALAKDGEKAGERTGIKFRDALKKEFESTKKLFKKETYIFHDDSFSKRKGSFTSKNKQDISEILEKKEKIKLNIFDEERGENDSKIIEKLKKELEELGEEEEKLSGIKEKFSKASIEQQSAYLALLDEQVPADKAIAALQEELTDDKIHELAIQTLLNGTQKVENDLTDEEIKAKEKAIKAKLAEQSTDKMGILTKAKYLFLLVFGSEEQKKDAKAKLKNAGATWTLKIAEDALNGSLAVTVILIGTVIAAAIALGFAIYKIAKNIKENSLEYKLEKAAEATEKAKEAANAARQSYEDLKDSIQGIGDAEKEIDKLTHGTLEWQQAILGVNQDIMELINKFPKLRSELLKELQVNSNGKLVLSSKGYELIEQEGFNRYQNLYSQQLVSGSEEDKLKRQLALDEFYSGKSFVFTETKEKTPEETETSKKNFFERVLNFLIGIEQVGSANNAVLTDAVMGTNTVEEELKKSVSATRDAIAGYDREEDKINKEEIYSQFVENPEMFTESNEELENFAKKIGTTSDRLLDFVPEMQKRQEAELEYTISARSHAKQIILANISDDYKEKDNIDELTDTFSDFFTESQEKEVAQEIENINTQDLSEYAKELGINNFVSQGDELKNLQRLYEDLTGATEEEIEDMFGDNKDELKKAIAAIKVSKNWGKKVEGFADELDSFAEEIGDTEKEKFIRELFGGADGVGLTKGNWDLDETNMSAIHSFWADNEPLQEQFNEDFQAFYEWAEKQTRKAKDIYTAAIEDLSSYGFDAETMFSDNMEIGAIKGLSKNYIEIFKKSGKEGVIELSNQINEIFASLEAEDPEKAKQFAAALNSITWDNKESIEGLSDNLDELGITIDPTVGDVEDLEDQIAKLGKASSKVSLENLIEDIQNLGTISHEITSGERVGRSFSKEDVDLLVSTGTLGTDDFSYNIETGDYTYLGDSTNRIVKAIEQQTDDLLGTSKYKDKVTSGMVAKELLETKKLSTDSYSDKVAFLKAYWTALPSDTEKPFTYDFITTAEKNINNKRVQQDIDEMYNQIMDDYTNLASNKVNYKKIAKEGAVSQAQLKYSATDLAKMIGESRTRILISGNTKETDNDINIYMEALMNEAVASGVPQSQINEYIKEIEQLNNLANNNADQKDIKKQLEKLNKIERELGDTASNLKTGSRLKNNVGASIELLDEYEDLKDEASKIVQVQKMLDSYGVSYKVDSSNYKDIYNYVLGAARGESEGYRRLVSLETKTQGVEATSKGTFKGLKKTGKYAADSDVAQMITNMVEKGALTEESVDLSKRSSYNNTLLVSFDAEGNKTYKTVTAATKLTKDSVIVRPRRSDELLTSATLGGGGEDYWPSEDEKDKDKKDKKNKWEHSYDGFYNINEEINKLIKERNDLEREHEKLIQNENATADDYYNSYTKRLKNYKEEVSLQKQALDLRKQERKKLQEKYSDLKEYAWIENGQVKINLKKIDAVTDEDLGQDIEDYISALEENLEATETIEESIDEGIISINELNDAWRETTANFERKIYDALVETREKDIEEMQTLADTLDEAANDLVSAIQEEINERRRDRENKETEEDIADKEKRLAYLQQDTSGAYDQEILDLQKELEEQKEDYTDTLIDQKISDLQDQNDDAAKQRERQIKIAQTQLQYDIESGKISKEALSILKNASTSKGQKSLWSLLKGTDEYENLTSYEAEIWNDENRNSLLEALSYLKAEDRNVLKETLAELEKDPPKRELEMTKRKERDKDEDEEDEEEKTIDYKDINYNNDKDQYKPTKSMIINGKTYKYIKEREEWYEDKDLTAVKGSKGLYTIKSQANGYTSIMSSNSTISKAIILGTAETEDKSKSQARTKYAEENINGETYYFYDNNYYKNSSLKTKKKNGQYITYFPKNTKTYKKYKTGGLVDYTGPAWLDGTKSKPELVLNQAETKNFLTLKDVLSNFMDNTNELIGSNNNQSGDTNYEISINVEKLTNDYDVEQVANKIKQMVASDARYRNSNFISRLR